MSLSIEIEKAKESLLECFDLSQKYGDEEIKNSQLYLDAASKLLEVKEKEARTTAALNAVKESCGTLADFDDEFKRELKKHAKKFNVKNTADYKSFAAALQRLKGATCGAPDDMLMQVEINVFDPLSKKRMENPVKNVICGHHYEQSTILEAIKINSRLRCPVSGCGNREFVKESDLQFDHEFRKQLQNSIE